VNVHDYYVKYSFIAFAPNRSSIRWKKTWRLNGPNPWDPYLWCRDFHGDVSQMIQMYFHGDVSQARISGLG